MNREELEKDIQSKGLNAPRLNPELINSKVIKEEYYVFPDSLLTVCCLTLENGFNVTGESACVSKENFNKETGEKVSKIKAIDKIWALEGYLLKEKNKNGKLKCIV